MADRAPRGIRIQRRGATPATTRETYEVDVICVNCNWKGKAAIPKGVPVVKGTTLDNLAACETCGCITLRRLTEEEEAIARRESDVERMQRELAESLRVPTIPHENFPGAPYVIPFLPPATPYTQIPYRRMSVPFDQPMPGSWTYGTTSITPQDGMSWNQP